ncbi:hypothetical protein ACOSQ3_009739 [Xanthoceras sorbifolium]
MTSFAVCKADSMAPVNEESSSSGEGKQNQQRVGEIDVAESEQVLLLELDDDDDEFLVAENPSFFNISNSSNDRRFEEQLQQADLGGERLCWLIRAASGSGQRAAVLVDSKWME